MRSFGDIKMELIKLRFDKKYKLPLAKIAKDSGCSVNQVISAMKMTASETIFRRIDAYLDAKQLHVPEKMSKTIWKIEQMTRELWREYQARTIPMRDVMNRPPEEQKRLCVAMDFRLKRLLYEKIEGEHKIKVSFHDGETYWHYKSRVLARQGIVAEKRKPYLSKGASTVDEIRKTFSYKN